VTLKRYFSEKGKVRLEPANSSMKPIVLDESKNPNAEILGVLVGVLRKC
jgi:repressor LexA